MTSYMRLKSRALGRWLSPLPSSSSTEIRLIFLIDMRYIYVCEYYMYMCECECVCVCACHSRLAVASRSYYKPKNQKPPPAARQSRVTAGSTLRTILKPRTGGTVINLLVFYFICL